MSERPLVSEGMAHFNAGRLALARDCFAAAGDAPEARCFLAHTLQALGKPEKALAIFSDLARSRPDYLPGRLGLAAALQAAGRGGPALAAAEAALKLAPRRPEVLALARGLWSERGRALARSGRAGKAAVFLSRAVAAGAQDLDTRRLLAECLGASGKARRALALWRNLARDFPDFLPASLETARGLLRSGHARAAEKILLGVLAREPRSGEARELLAEMLLSRPSADSLRRALAAKIGGDEPRAFVTRALPALGNDPDARALFARALRGGAFDKEGVADALLALARRGRGVKPALELLDSLSPARAATSGEAAALRSRARFSRARPSSAARRKIVKEGFAVIRGCAPAALVDAARVAIDERFSLPPSPGQGSRLGEFGEYRSEYLDEPAVMDLLYRTPAWSLAESLIGRGRVLPCELAQVVLRPPVPRSAETGIGLHIDGVYDAGAVLDLKKSSFTLLLCFLLNDWPEEFCGNFAVSPGSHRIIERAVRRGGASALKKGFSRLALPSPVSVTGKSGDLILAHYQLAHDGQRNYSPRTRYAVFFRLRHTAHEKRWKRALADLWLEWEGLRRQDIQIALP